MEVKPKSTLFDGFVVFLSPGTKFSQEHERLAQLLTENGALVVNNLNKRVSHVVCDAADTSPSIRTAQYYGIKLIHEAFFLDQLAARSKAKSKSAASGQPKESDYLLDEEDMKPAHRATTTVTSTSDAAKTTMKRAREENDNDDTTAVFRTKKTKTTRAQRTKQRGVVPVDGPCPLGNKVHVYVEAGEEANGNKKEGIPWACMLNQTNIAQNNNKFYVLQLLENSNGTQWWLWTRWGRVGLKGQSSLVAFKSLAAGKLAFEKKFLEKTGNEWSDCSHFQSHPGKYTLIELDYGEDEETKTPTEEPNSQSPGHGHDDKQNVAKKDEMKEAIEHNDEDEEEEDEGENDEATLEESDTKSALPPSVFDLVSLIFDKSAMNHQMAAMNYDVQKMPLGKLKKTTINKGMDILKKIEKALQEGRKHDLTALSSQFYTLIPHAFGMTVPPVINTPQMLQEKIQMLETLSDIHLANTLSKQSRQKQKHEVTKVHPIDAKYAQLKAKLIPLDAADPLYQIVTKYVQSTHGVTHNQYTLRVCDVFRVEREGECARFQQHCATLLDTKNTLTPNVHLLWHGSRLSNYVGILSHGLRVAPLSAPSTGYMFGKGIYFADCCSKSANYCHIDLAKLNSPTTILKYPDNIGLLLLCQVALGQPQILTKAKYIVKLPKGFHSVKAEGVYSAQKHTQHTYIDARQGGSGVEVVVPLGPLVDTGKKHGIDTDLNYNEYVVYTSDQVLTDFLVKVEFLPANKPPPKNNTAI
jgi:poly [ADP-ribose] polymerase